MERAVSAEESTVSQDSDSPPKKRTGEIRETASRTRSLEPVSQDNYECSICLSWLKDPVLTTCGHRFCKSCLDEWRSKNNTKCPLDDMNLSIQDIFPDNFTKREIENMRKSFPDQFDPPNPIFECKFSTVGCDYKSENPSDVERHGVERSQEHMDMLLSSHLKSQFGSWDPMEKTKSPTRELVGQLYERIVILEQQNHEQAMRIENQEMKLGLQERKIERLQQMETRRNGTLLWEIKDFQKKVDLMKSNPLQMFYSPECFTDPTGYKFCARMALKSKRDILSFFVHFMKSENDRHLQWPFSGKITIMMINEDPSQSSSDVVMSNPEIKAFHRPQDDVSTRGYGFMEYADISEIKRTGFLVNDCLTIKIQVNIV